MNDTTKPRFTAREKMQAAQREVGFRRFVYPKKVADPNHRMTQEQADREIALMDEIARDYGQIAQIEEAGEDLLRRDRATTNEEKVDG
jgi:hypothetical protein